MTSESQDCQTTDFKLGAQSTSPGTGQLHPRLLPANPEFSKCSRKCSLPTLRGLYHVFNNIIAQYPHILDASLGVFNATYHLNFLTLWRGLKTHPTEKTQKAVGGLGSRDPRTPGRLPGPAPVETAGWRNKPRTQSLFCHFLAAEPQMSHLQESPQQWRPTVMREGGNQTQEASTVLITHRP